jgi:hypothetical protein
MRAVVALMACTVLCACSNASTLAGRTSSGSSISFRTGPSLSAAPSAPNASLVATRGVVPSAGAAPSTGGSGVPWIDAPLPKPAPPPDPNAPVVHRKVYRACTATDLAGDPGGWGGAGGTGYRRLGFTNTSPTPCTLADGPLALIGVSGTGRPVKVGGPGSGFGLHLDQVANLQHGATAYVELVNPGECGMALTAPYYARLQVELADGSLLTMQTPKDYERLGVGCSYGVSGFGPPHHEVPEPTYPTSPLVITNTMPAHVLAGGIVDFTVTLHNPTARNVPLTPCPAYEEALNVYPDVVDRVYQLNCSHHTKLAPGEALTFAMRITAPGHPGGAKFGWYLLPLGGSGTGGVTQVT